MALPQFSMRQLLEAGAHFGHQTRRWNPKMDRYIFGSRSGVHIIDLSQTIPLLHQALVKVREVAAAGGRVLFVGTKRQASDPVAMAAKRCAQYYVNHRWLGGTLTNWRTVSASIARLRDLETALSSDTHGRKKREVLQMTRELHKLERSLGGIRDMGGLPDIVFVIDTNKEAIAIKESRKLNIPVVAILDTNSDPDGVAYPVPGNDDAARALQLYCDLVADAVLDGLAAGQAEAGVDLGAAIAPSEPAIAEVRSVTPMIPGDSPLRRADLPHDFAPPHLSDILPDVDVDPGLRFDNRSFHAARERRTQVEFECSIEFGEDGGIDDFVGRWEWAPAPIGSFARILTSTFEAKALNELTIDILLKDVIETYQDAGPALRNGDFVKHCNQLLAGQREPIGLRAYFADDQKRFELFVSKIVARDVTMIAVRGTTDLFPMMVEAICRSAQQGSAAGQRGRRASASTSGTTMSAMVSAS